MSDIAIDSLSDTDARKLYEQLGFRFSRQASDNLNANEAMVWTALRDVTGSRQSASVFIQGHGKARFTEDVQTLTLYMKGSVAGTLSRTREQALMRMIIGCLAAYMKSRDIPVSPKGVLNMAEYAADAVDRSFPGYARSKMLGYLVQDQT